ncbi:MAG: hypothetical protein H6624_08515 [Bdellovibrionaceae bacterium]|nr:hypothetical protein [Bdellovibrionales bacterium]MCB9084375.1 hypothetical protein [Pseudobdellovibrionaceae bacterium]
MGKYFCIFSLLSALTLGCAGGTTSGNPVVEVNLDTYSPVPTAKPGASIASMATPFNVSSLVMCFKRLRFKTENETTNGDPTQDDDNIDLELGEVVLSPSGTSLTSVSVPKGIYTRVEFDLEKDCADGTSGNSLQVTNGSGLLTTDERITIKFEGIFTVDESSEILNLGIQNIINALDTATAGNELKNKAEGASGSF